MIDKPGATHYGMDEKSGWCVLSIWLTKNASAVCISTVSHCASRYLALSELYSWIVFDCIPGQPHLVFPLEHDETVLGVPKPGILSVLL